MIRPCVPISKALNLFLRHDSHVDCSINMVDEYEIDEAMRRDGVIGSIDISYAPLVLDKMTKAVFINQRDKDRLAILFAPYCS